MTFINVSAGAAARAISPASADTVTVTMTMLRVWPIDLMVASTDDATPYSALSTHDMTALVFGDENSENPTPVITRAVMTSAK